MEMKHTSGPWFIWKEAAIRAESDDKEYIDDEMAQQKEHQIMAGSPIGEVTRGSIRGCQSICNVDPFDYEEAQEEAAAIRCLADARLIAAAPELLEALILLEAEMVLSGNERSTDYGWKPAIEKTRAAIAKATGEQA